MPLLLVFQGETMSALSKPPGSRVSPEPAWFVMGDPETVPAPGLRIVIRLVTRTVFPTIPPRVDYELTPLGHSLRLPVQALGAWAFEHQPAIAKAREDFDGRVS